MSHHPGRGTVVIYYLSAWCHTSFGYLAAVLRTELHPARYFITCDLPVVVVIEQVISQHAWYGDQTGDITAWYGDCGELLVA